MGPGRALGLGLLLGVLGGTASGLHSLRYYDVSVLEPSPGVPQYTIVGYVDGNLIGRYDSDTGRAVPHAEWVAANVDQLFLDIREHQQRILNFLDKVRAHYNQSGTHMWQRVYGCDILEDGSVRGFWQTAYDGRDFIAFDTDTMTFTAADTAAQINKRYCEANRSEVEQMKHYLEIICPNWLRRYVSYGQAVLERKEPPTVRVSGKEAHGSLTLSCRAYGFYPRDIAISWLRDGEVWDHEAERGDVVPNADGTYYTRTSIEVPPGQKDKYRCRVEHAGLAEPGLYAWEPPESSSLPLVLGVVAAIGAVATIVAGFTAWKWKGGKMMKEYHAAPSSDGSSCSSATGISA